MKYTENEMKQILEQEIEIILYYFRCNPFSAMVFSY